MPEIQPADREAVCAYMRECAADGQLAVVMTTKPERLLKAFAAHREAERERIAARLEGMCPAFYQFMGAGSPRSDSGEILMCKDSEAPDPAAELVAKAREVVEVRARMKAGRSMNIAGLADEFDNAIHSLAAALAAFEKGGAK